MAKRKNQSEHDSMLEILKNHLEKNKFTNLRIDISGASKPDPIHWKVSGISHIPDATSTFGIDEYIYEVETSDSVFDSHTESQWKLFATHAQETSKKFIVVVPKESHGDATRRAGELGIKLHDIWTIG